MSNFGHMIVIGVLLLICLLLVLGFILFSASEPGYIAFTNEFAQQMEENADIAAIRAWVNGLPNRDDDVYFLDKSEWPECVKGLLPMHVGVSAYDNDGNMVRLTWGGGFGHWGLVVGPEIMETPKSDVSQYGEYRVPLEPGAYLFHEVQ